ncbi:hypothetical protein SRHO_G00319370 [Serrasalmus rhombeus]
MLLHSCSFPVRLSGTVQGHGIRQLREVAREKKRRGRSGFGGVQHQLTPKTQKKRSFIPIARNHFTRPALSGTVQCERARRRRGH